LTVQTQDDAAAGNQAATRREMLLLLPDLRGFARFLVRDRVAADDLVQDTVVQALGALGQFQSGTNLKAWLFTILRNQFFAQARRRKREAELLQAHFQAEQGSVTGDDLADLGDLQRMLWTLPPLLREALVLVGAQELSYDEAAAICAVPVGTVKARVSRARAALARVMDDRSAQPGVSVHL